MKTLLTFILSLPLFAFADGHIQGAEHAGKAAAHKEHAGETAHAKEHAGEAAAHEEHAGEAAHAKEHAGEPASSN